MLVDDKEKGRFIIMKIEIDWEGMIRYIIEKIKRRLGFKEGETENERMTVSEADLQLATDSSGYKY